MLNKVFLTVFVVVSLSVFSQLSVAQGNVLSPNVLIDNRSDDTFSPIGYATFEDFGVKYFILGNFNSDLDDGGRLAFKFLSSTSTRYFYQTLKQYVVLNNPQNVISDLTGELNDFYRSYKGEFVSGDHLAIDRDVESVKVKLNGVIIVSDLSSDLYQVLLNAWVGSVPPSRSFKGELLGKNDFSSSQSLFNTLSYEIGRQEQVISSLQDLKKKELVPTKAVPSIRAPKIPSASIAPPVPVRSTPKKQIDPVAIAVVEKPNVDVKPPANVVNAKTDAPKVAVEVNQRSSQVLAKIESERQEKEKQRELLNRAKELEKLAFANKLMRHARQNIVYPRRAQKLKHVGQVVALVTIDKNGDMLNFELQEEAKYDSLNDAVEKGVKKSDPFPSIPKTLADETFSFSLPIKFAI